VSRKPAIYFRGAYNTVAPDPIFEILKKSLGNCVILTLFDPFWPFFGPLRPTNPLYRKKGGVKTDKNPDMWPW
jgi:hypothetical protein